MTDSAIYLITLGHVDYLLIIYCSGSPLGSCYSYFCDFEGWLLIFTKASLFHQDNGTQRESWGRTDSM